MTSTTSRPGQPAGQAPPDDSRRRGWLRWRPASWAHRPGLRRFTRYAAGSVIAFAVSNLTFLVLYGLELTSPQVASVLAFTAGIPVNWILNRRWAWQRRGRPGMTDELLPYAAVILVSVAASAVGTWAVDRWLATLTLPRAIQVGLVDATYVGITGGLFLAKYFLLDRLVFRRRARKRPAATR